MMDRNLALEMVRVTERAAVACAPAQQQHEEAGEKFDPS